MAELVLLLKKIWDGAYWLISHATQVLWVLAIVWLVFASSRLVNFLVEEYPKQATPVLIYFGHAQPAIHILGLAVLLLAAFATYYPRREKFRFVWSIFRDSSTVWMLSGGVISDVFSSNFI
jgi:hypothetical protein